MVRAETQIEMPGMPCSDYFGKSSQEIASEMKALGKINLVLLTLISVSSGIAKILLLPDEMEFFTENWNSGYLPPDIYSD